MQLKSLLEQHGHKVAVFAMQYPDNLSNEFSEYWPSKVDFEKRNPKKLFEALRRPLGVKEVETQWIKLLADFNPDIIHLHNIHSQLSPIIARIAKKQGIPVFWTLHDYKLVCPAYVLMRDGKVCEECFNKPTSVIKHRCIKNNLVGSVIGYLETLKWNKNNLQDYTNLFIAPSKFLRTKMIEGGIESEKIVHLYNFMDDVKFKVANSRKKYYLYLGRLSHEKGLNTLFEAAIKNCNAILKIVGDGPIRDELEEKFNSDHIQFLGFQSWEKIKKLLGEAKFMVIPSEWYENNPLSVLESLAVGTPVLGASIGGIPELINESNGMLFESANSIDLTNKINLMLKKEDWNYNKISKDAKKKFSEESFYQSIMEIYNNSVDFDIS